MTMKQWNCSTAAHSRGRIVSYRAQPPGSHNAIIFWLGREIRLHRKAIDLLRRPGKEAYGEDKSYHLGPRHWTTH